MSFERLFMGVELSERPLFMVSTLLVLFGLQLFGLGLIGEIVIFSNANKRTEYTVKEVIQSPR